MTTTQQTVLIVFGAVVIAHPLFMRLLAGRVEPSRKLMMELGDELLSSNIGDAAKNYVRCMLDDAYDWRFMALLAVYTPIFLCRIVLNRVFGWPKINAVPEVKGTDLKEKFQRFNSYHIESIAAANPVCALIAAVEIACLVLVLFPVGRMAKAMSISFGAMMSTGRWLHQH